MESAFERARRDTWPQGWVKKWVHRVIAAGIALGAAYWLGSGQTRAEFFTKLETGAIGVLAILVADILFYPWNLLLAPFRQRDDLRSRLRAIEAARNDFALLTASAEWGSGARRRIVVHNEGTRRISNIRIDLGASNWAYAEGWRSGAEVIPMLNPGESDSIPFFVRQSMGMRSERVRARLSGTCSSGEAVTVEVLLDPHSLT